MYCKPGKGRRAVPLRLLLNTGTPVTFGMDETRYFKFRVEIDSENTSACVVEYPRRMCSRSCDFFKF